MWHSQRRTGVDQLYERARNALFAWIGKGWHFYRDPCLTDLRGLCRELGLERRYQFSLAEQLKNDLSYLEQNRTLLTDGINRIDHSIHVIGRYEAIWDVATL